MPLVPLEAQLLPKDLILFSMALRPPGVAVVLVLLVLLPITGATEDLVAVVAAVQPEIIRAGPVIHQRLPLVKAITEVMVDQHLVIMQVGVAVVLDQREAVLLLMVTRETVDLDRHHRYLAHL